MHPDSKNSTLELSYLQAGYKATSKVAKYVKKEIEKMMLTDLL